MQTFKISIPSGESLANLIDTVFLGNAGPEGSRIIRNWTHLLMDTSSERAINSAWKRSISIGIGDAMVSLPLLSIDNSGDVVCIDDGRF